MSTKESFIDLSNQLAALGECMYCGATSKLTREHIVPYGLGGPGAMPKSTCPECADITSKFEREVLRGPLRGLRAYMRLSSRRKNQMPMSMPFILIRNGKEEEVSLPISQHPVMITFPAFAVPSKLTGKHVSGVTVRGAFLFNFGKPLDEVLREHDAEHYRVTETSRPLAFARLLAKIAWGIAIASGYHKQLDPELRDSFLYSPDTIGQWVGTYSDPLKGPEKNMLHEIRIHEDYKSGFLIGDIRLFSLFQTPQYGVILGKLASNR